MIFLIIVSVFTVGLLIGGLLEGFSREFSARADFNDDLDVMYAQDHPEDGG